MVNLARPYVGLFPVFVLVALVVAFGLFTRQASREAQLGVDHTHSVIEHLQLELEGILNAETGQRGFLLSEDTAYLTSYNAAHQLISTTADQLRQLVGDNPDQMARLRALQGVISAKLDELAQTVTLAKAGHHDEAIAIIRTDIGRNLMLDIRARIAVMIDAEQILLARRQAEAETTRGRVKWVTYIGTSGAALFAVLLFMTLSRDQKRRAAAAVELARMESRYRGLLEAAPDAMVVVNQAGDIVLLNVQAEKQFGYSRGELVGQAVKNIIPEGFAERLKADDLRSAADALAQQIGTGIELVALRKDGSEFPIELMLSPLESAEGILVTAAIRDISVRREAEKHLEQTISELGLLSAKLAASEAMMVEAETIARVGSWDLDLQSKRLAWSAEMFRIFGLDPATTTPSYATMLARVHPDDRPAVKRDFPELYASRTDRTIDHRIVMDDGAVKAVHQHVRTTYNTEGQALNLIGIVQDITERKNAEDKLQFANILLQTEMEASPDGILVVDAKRRITSFNIRFAYIWKIPLPDLVAGNDDMVLANLASLVKDPQKFAAQVGDLYNHPDKASHDELETTDGRIIERHTVSLLTPGGENLGRVWFFRDITERKHAEASALHMARHDVLTGLANREDFVEALQHPIAQAKRGGKGFAVIYLDLDHFKDVNDTLGHPVGDQLLKAVADRLRSNTRETDTVARFGGDEFAVVLPDISEPSDAGILADKLIKAIADPFAIQGNDIHTGASIGIDLFGPEAADAETLLSHADVALYRAKSEGRGSYRFFTEAMDAEVRARVTLGAELREAIDGGQLFLAYQPQVAVDSERITGVEALVRWHHPTRGILGPELFIPLAEKIGLVTKLGRWVLWTACRQAKAWMDEDFAPIRIAVNVSVLQFKTPMALETEITAALAETGLPPELLELELTETVVMTASQEHYDILPRLRQAGVTLALDHFGTGYSSLEYLSQFPADRIKIAQNFVKHLETMPRDAAIVKATIGLAREMGIKVIAEGVETREQLELLKGWGCPEVQGFYFAAPLMVEDVTLLMRAGGILQPGAGSIQSK